jgi:hypothetical protein
MTVLLIFFEMSYRTPIPEAFLTALLEASIAASSLVPSSLRQEFVLVGSGAMLYHGSRRRAEDLDIVDTAVVHGAFLEGARLDKRFSVLADGGRFHPHIPLYQTFMMLLLNYAIC